MLPCYSCLSCDSLFGFHGNFCKLFNAKSILSKETIVAIIMLYKNTKIKVPSPDGDTDDFVIVTGVLQGDTLAPYLFIICLDYVLRTSIDLMKENGFKLVKERSRRYPLQTITDAEYADDIALLANTPAQVESLLHSLEWATGGIGLHINADKTEYMCFNQKRHLHAKGWSFEAINMRLVKAWTAIDGLSFIWKSDVTDKLKRSFFQAAVVRYCHMDAQHGR